MHELSPGSIPPNHVASPSTPWSPDISFGGQFGIIDFDTTIRLPRHVHISGQNFTAERILVISGTALVELNKQVYVIPPRTLVTIAPGVPHTWTACPAGLNISKIVDLRNANRLDSHTSAARILSTEPLITDGRFVMIYEYEEITGFFPTEQVGTIDSVEDYVRCDDFESIRFPLLTAGEVCSIALFVWKDDVWKHET